MAVEQNIPTPWIGAEELPLHFANAFGVGAGANAIFVLFGSVVPPGADGAGLGPYIPVRPIVRLAIAPDSLPQLIGALEQAYKTHQAEASEE